MDSTYWLFVVLGASTLIGWLAVRGVQAFRRKEDELRSSMRSPRKYDEHEMYEDM